MFKRKLLVVKLRREEFTPEEFRKLHETKGQDDPPFLIEPNRAGT